MAFVIYPDEPTAALLGRPARAPVELAATGPESAMSKFVPLTGRLHSPGQSGSATTFIRIAFSGPPASSSQQPTIELFAHEPDLPGAPPATRIDPNSTSLMTAVELFDDVSTTRVARAHFVDAQPYADNVYPLRVVLDVEETKLWIKITNTTGVKRDVVWVEADNDADSRQPWIHSAPAGLSFDVTVGDAPRTTDITIKNRGTGAATITGVTPPIEPPYAITGLPVTLPPATPAIVKIGFTVPGTPGNNADIQHRLIVSNDAGPFGDGHNHAFTLGAKTRAKSDGAVAPPRPAEFAGPCKARVGPGAGRSCFCPQFVQRTGHPEDTKCQREGCGHHFMKHLPLEDQPPIG